MSWKSDWDAYIAEKEAELAELEAWIAEKSPKKARGRKVYEVVSNDRLLLGLLGQRVQQQRDLADMRKYVTRRGKDE